MALKCRSRESTYPAPGELLVFHRAENPVTSYHALVWGECGMAEVSNTMIGVGRRFAARPRQELALVCFVLVLIIGYIDYITGAWISLSVVYVVPIAIAAWYLGRLYAYTLAGIRKSVV